MMCHLCLGARCSLRPSENQRWWQAVRPLKPAAACSLGQWSYSSTPLMAAFYPRCFACWPRHRHDKRIWNEMKYSIYLAMWFYGSKMLATPKKTKLVNSQNYPKYSFAEAADRFDVVATALLNATVSIDLTKRNRAKRFSRRKEPGKPQENHGFRKNSGKWEFYLGSPRKTIDFWGVLGGVFASFAFFFKKRILLKLELRGWSISGSAGHALVVLSSRAGRLEGSLGRKRWTIQGVYFGSLLST